MQCLDQWPGKLFPVDDVLTHRFGVKNCAHGVAPLFAPGLRNDPEQRKYSVMCVIAHDDVPRAIEYDGWIRLLPLEDEPERASHMLQLGRRERAFAVDGRI